MRRPDLFRPVRRRLLSRAVHTARPDHRIPVHVSGPSPDRILVLGTEIASGVGSRTDDLALPGHLARSLSAETGRGVDVDVTARLRLDIVAIIELVKGGMDIGRHDVVVLAVGASEILSALSVEAWRLRLGELLTSVHGAIGDHALVVLLHPDVDNWAPYIPGRITPHLRTRGEKWAATADEVASTYPRTSTICTPRRLSPPDTQWRSDDYRLWGSTIAAHIAERLPGAAAVEREEVMAEAHRLHAVEAVALGGSDADGGTRREIARVLRSTRNWFGASAVAFTVVDGADVTIAQALGLDPGLSAPRSESACDVTIRRPGGFVVLDMLDDPRYSRSAAESGIRFYAGYRVEGIGGQPVGALCVYDSAPRSSFDETEMRMLRDLATRISVSLQR